MFRLKKWGLSLEPEGFIGCGDCYGNPKFLDGEFILTSYVVRAEVSDSEKRLKLFTVSGSCYVMDYADINESCLESTRAVLSGRGIPVDLRMCVALKEQKDRAVKERLAGVLKPKELYVVMQGGIGISEAYFKTEKGSVVPVRVKVHTGMFQDSIIVADWRTGLCDWRIFPSVFSVEPYHWSDGLEAVYMENIGEDFVFKGSKGEILCRSGDTTVVRKGDFVGEGLLSPDTVNGKSLFSADNGDLFQ